MNDLVSIIIPVYNAERFIDETINSVLNQTYTNWELILVNDCSTDKSREIIEKYVKQDKRIKLINNEVNSRAAVSRNNGIKIAKGRFLCYLDADDLWDKYKIEKQIRFMKEKDCAFSYTGYEFADKDGIPKGKKVHIPSKIDYRSALRNTIIWTCTVMFDMNQLSKEDIYMPNVKSEDTASWWSILKKIDYAYGLNEILSYYRRTSGTLSSDKIEGIRRIWNLYRNVEHLNVVYSAFNFVGYAIHAIWKRI